VRSLLPLAAAAALALGCSSAGAGGRHLRVLFVGNSLTATNDLPAAVARIGAAEGVRVDYETFAPGGVSLADQWRAGAARHALDTGGFDVVVLQQGPSSLASSGVELTASTKRWAAEARAHGVRPALLTVWPERERAYAFPAVIAHHRTAARAAHAALFPAGVAWQEALRRGVAVYGPDGFHPSAGGTYLTAVVVYAGLTGALPKRIEGPSALRTAVRKALLQTLFALR
jgi:hypothetical protein